MPINTSADEVSQLQPKDIPMLEKMIEVILKKIVNCVFYFQSLDRLQIYKLKPYILFLNLKI